MTTLTLNSLATSDACCTLTISHIPKNLAEVDILTEIKAAVGQSSFILYMQQEKQNRTSARAFVCFNSAVDAMLCCKAMNRKKLGAAKGKRCVVEMGLVLRRQVQQGASLKK